MSEPDLPKPSMPTADPPRCRTCGTPIPRGAEFHPFCSTRCRDADLNKWFSGEYRITRDIKESDLETND